jgi:hypothetical protein
MRWVNYFEHKWVSFGECQRPSNCRP